MAKLGVDPPPKLRAWTFAHDGDEYVVFEWDGALVEAPRALTRTERELLERVLCGESNERIAKARGTKPRTVANQLASIYRKLGVCSRTELIARLVRADAKG